jgi:hypothetical protein
MDAIVEKTGVSPLDRLIAIEEIKTLKARYFRCVDAKLWDELLKTVLMPDLKCEFPDEKSKLDSPVWNSAKMFVDSASKVMTGAVTIHHGHTPEIEILSPTTARGIWCFQDSLHWPKGGPYPAGVHNLLGWGHYHETYTKTKDGWRIATLKITRLKLEFPE